MSAPIDGYDIPIHQALTTPILMGGAPRHLAIINGTLAAALGLGLQMWVAGLFLFVIGHTLSVFATRHDPDIIGVLIRHLRQKAYYSC